MTDFSDGFEHFVPPDQETIRAGVTNGLVVLDSNVLLSAYRFAPKSRGELLNALILVGDRLWIPHQVGLEFHRNRLKVIADYDAAYKDVIEALSQREKEFLPTLQQKIRELSNRVALPDEERDRLIRILTSGFRTLGSALSTLRDSHGVGNPASPDAIFKRIGELFTGKIGEPLTADEEALEKAESARRIENKQPPGFRDSDKDEPHGDYFVWCQTLREAKRRGSEVLVFVTSDTKEDWYLRLKGQTIMARPELALECFQNSGARLVMFPTRSFLTFAQRYLRAEVSDETIRQAEQAQSADERRKQFQNARRHASLLQSEQVRQDTLFRNLRDEFLSLREQRDEIKRRLSDAAELQELAEIDGEGVTTSQRRLIDDDVAALTVELGVVDERLQTIQMRLTRAERDMLKIRAQREVTERDIEELTQRANSDSPN